MESALYGIYTLVVFVSHIYPAFEQLGPGDNVMVSGPIKYWRKTSMCNKLMKVYKRFLIGFAIFV